MSLTAIRARLNALRKNLPLSNAMESHVNDFNSMARELAEELRDPEISRFLIPEFEVKPRIVSVAPGRGAQYSKNKFCDSGLFKRQVEGLWAYLEDIGIVEAEKPSGTKPDKPESPAGIHFHAPVTGSIIQQGNDNTATFNYQSDVEKVLAEIKPLLNAAKLNEEQKRELNADFQSAEAQIRSPNPKRAIIRESLQSIRHVLEHAFGAGLAHAYFPLLVEFFKHH